MRKQKGFTLIELLIVVAIIGIIAAIAIPNLLDAIERSRQKRTVGDIRNLAGAIQTFATDNGGYPNMAEGNATGIQTASTDTFTPDYIQAIPASDGWKQPYNYATGALTVDRGVPNVPQVVGVNFGIYSVGSDGTGSMTGTGTVPAGGYAGGNAVGFTPDVSPACADCTATTNCYQSDILWVNSSFIQVPDGKQKKC